MLSDLAEVRHEIGCGQVGIGDWCDSKRIIVMESVADDCDCPVSHNFLIATVSCLDTFNRSEGQCQAEPPPLNTMLKPLCLEEKLHLPAFDLQD